MRKKILERYYRNKARLEGERRLCKCGTVLSRYNERPICVTCERTAATTEKELSQILADWG